MSILKLRKDCLINRWKSQPLEIVRLVRQVYWLDLWMTHLRRGIGVRLALILWPKSSSLTTDRSKCNSGTPQAKRNSSRWVKATSGILKDALQFMTSQIEFHSKLLKTNSWTISPYSMRIINLSLNLKTSSNSNLKLTIRVWILKVFR